ncbi:MAG TPA: anaerobic ribonucleoside-triphosphate reductase activating protein [Burkholderiaceae bacterium]
MSAGILKNPASAQPLRRFPRGLQVGGLVPFTATDYPGKLAAVVFVQGCPWRCGYCHNPHLQARDGDGAMAWSEVMRLLKRRIGLIDAVVFSGGEPTLDPALPAAIADVRGLGYAVGLHTACIYPDRLETVLPLLDWVGFDVKAPFDAYEKVTGARDSGHKASACVDLILASGVAHECRTTVDAALLAESEIMAIATDMAGRGVKSYALQLARATATVGESASTPGASRPSAATLRQLEALFARFTLRQGDFD